MSIGIVIAVLSLLLVIQQLFWMAHTSALTDKLMSRNFSEYKQAIVSSPKAEKPKEEQDPPEDLRRLQGFNL